MGFPKKRPFLKVKDIANLLSDDKEGQIIKNIDFLYFSSRASFMGNPVCKRVQIIKNTRISVDPEEPVAVSMS